MARAEADERQKREGRRRNPSPPHGRPEPTHLVLAKRTHLGNRASRAFKPEFLVPEDLVKSLILSDGINLRLQAPDQVRDFREASVNLADGFPLSPKCVQSARHYYLPHEWSSLRPANDECE
jgi:hypothetical protein